MNTKGELAGCRLAHPAGRQAGNSQSQKARGKLGPRDSIPCQTASRLPVANHVFLGSWMVDIPWEGHSQRSAPQKRHTAHLRRRARCTPRKPSGWDGGGIKSQPSTGYNRAHQAPGHLSCSELGQAQPILCLCGVPENLNLSGLDLGSACNPGPTSDSFQQSNLEPEQCRLGKHTRCEWGQTQCG